MRRTYGVKKATRSTAASAIFGTSDARKDPLISGRQVLSDITNAAESTTLNEDAKKSTEAEKSVSKEVEDDVIDAIENLNLHDDSEEIDELESPPRDAVPDVKAKKKKLVPKHDPQSKPLGFPHREHFEPLLSAYATDRASEMLVLDWAEILPKWTKTHKYEITKIAEASYAEVYRLIEEEASCVDGLRRSSILKVMRLKSPRDPESLECDTASRVEDVVSEIRIMNALTEIPGYVSFKDAFLVKGAAEPFLVNAWDEYVRTCEEEESYFTDPREYTEDTVFLVVELGDAGITLDDYRIESVEEVWDIFLGSVMALAMGEIDRGFEHRDLHENNICVVKVRDAAIPEKDSSLKWKNSGLEITLIDYGLSRATLPNGETMCYPLENDLGIFRGSDGHPQFNAYRKMRNHLFTGRHMSEKKAWHDEESRSLDNGHTWDEHVPYTNVIWLQYLLGYLKKQFTQSPTYTREANATFQTEIREIERGMSTRTKIDNGAFTSAAQVLERCMELGYIHYEDFEASGILG
ncbi:hypothetical protein HYALB_00012355 [Hymenoscyphus albidus]|uniref:non-specific serine/threonine protein kinase n=1 Tax=Hymenoscyphus albidus TaxID=595503 RepID=A0A9N9Q723_9HELO|nr:hypothetical protein HYALB_00012355 [Hymenoscyphus albidus]